ncbi:snRNP Sm proteins [Malassezia japonica]|uniref:LSM2-LSM8 complex subunit LSM8 n=1 Tax=Malassezia japonica TaxID=223818 RepID=A0AAF0F1U1_9BASI|nr:snRNP Sm proteins [Malassezia japonica]WFD41260.1 snRNP Sm proteins [Malassezia japonica]
MSSLQGYMEQQVLLVTQDGRVLVGNLRGYDALGSLVLSECVERIFSRDAGVEEVPLGVYILRGDSISLVGDLDLERDRKTDWASLTAEPIPVTKHT